MSQETLKEETQHEVCPHGDVILVVGREVSSERFRLRASSQCLRTASDVFNAMFGPQWTKRLSLNPEQPATIEFPEDDPEAMHVVCCIIHNQNNAIPDRINSRLALQIGIVSDKYDLSTTLKYFIPKCFEAVSDTRDKTELSHYLVGAFLLGRDDAFEQTCQKLVIECRDSFFSLFDDDLVRPFLPARLIYTLEEGKGQLWREVLHKLMTDKDGICAQCNWADHRSDRYRDILQAALAKNNSLGAITEIINSMQHEYKEYSDVYREHACCTNVIDVHSYERPDEWFENLLRQSTPDGFKLKSWRNENT